MPNLYRYKWSDKNHGWKREEKILKKHEIFIKNSLKQEGMANIGWQITVGESLGTGALVPFGYISGYKEAADKLTDEATKDGLEDLYVFPIMFLYRQYLELILKNMYFKFSEGSIQEKVTFIKKHGHKLRPYWKKCERLLWRSKMSPDNIDKIGSLVSDFEGIDEHSFTFRFYMDKESNITLPKDLCIDLKRLKQVVNELDDLLYGT
jgi:hypothetical protein